MYMYDMANENCTAIHPQLNEKVYPILQAQSPIYGFEEQGPGGERGAGALYNVVLWRRRVPSRAVPAVVGRRG